MRVVYDGPNDTVYIELRDEPASKSEELRPGLFAKIDTEGRIVGIEIVNAEELVENPTSIQVQQFSG